MFFLILKSVYGHFYDLECFLQRIKLLNSFMYPLNLRKQMESGGCPQYISLPYLKHLGPPLFRVMSTEKIGTQKITVVGRE